ncbi:MAG TPA: hypothetical protein P5250_05650 [Bacteroidales bacterium]|nr:hypothetical protein [Bacteroidales bacterium]
MGLFFFKDRKPKQFEYKPYFYNPEKEKFNERVSKIKKELGIDNNNNAINITYKPSKIISFRNQKTKLSPKIQKGKLVIIIIAVILLIVMLYLIGLYSVYILKNG